MADAVFDAAFAQLLTFEGGFQDGREDPGNWTGGKVGAGELKGTNMGISAAAYPNEDIAHLTKERAHDLYLVDWWNRYGLWRLPPRVSTKLFLVGVDIGMESAFLCLQRALWACGQKVAEDGKLGDQTLGVLNKVQYDALAASLKSEMAAHYRLVAERNPDEAKFLPSWLNRSYA